MKIIRTTGEMSAEAKDFKRRNRTIGFVPTMGCFHEGHLSLFRRAGRESDVVVVSLYVNPTQFSPMEDYRRYPRNFKRDAALARREGVNVLFKPSDRQVYPDDFSTFVCNSALSSVLEGRSRPTHFRGVTTILTKLFHWVTPDTVYLGQKDYQQALIVRRMAEDLNFPIRVKVSPTIREKDGLAMSSRNLYLTPEERKRAPALFSALRQGRDMILSGTESSTEILKKLRNYLRRIPGMRVDYLRIVNPETLEEVKEARKKTLLVGAVWVGNTRLIDNLRV